MVHNTNFKSHDTSIGHSLYSIKTLLLNDQEDKIIQLKK